MRFNFNINDIMGEMPTFTIEQYIGHALVNSTSISGLPQMVIMDFANLCQQASQSPQPIKLICRGYKDIELPNGEWVKKPSRIEYYNNHWDGEEYN